MSEPKIIELNEDTTFELIVADYLDSFTKHTQDKGTAWLATETMKHRVVELLSITHQKVEAIEAAFIDSNEDLLDFFINDLLNPAKEEYLAKSRPLTNSDGSMFLSPDTTLIRLYDTLIQFNYIGAMNLTNRVDIINHIKQAILDAKTAVQNY